MTFDEAIGQLNPRTIWSPEMRDLLEQLRATYAPTIKMTRKEYNYFKWLRDTNDSLFEAFLTVSANENELSQFPELSLTQAWLHPECIKVVN